VFALGLALRAESRTVPIVWAYMSAETIGVEVVDNASGTPS